MNDLELTCKCAEAMGGMLLTYPDGVWRFSSADTSPYTNVFSLPKYNPLTDDAQAMALVKKFLIHITPHEILGSNYTTFEACICGKYPYVGESDDLNRAICECVAKMQEGK